MNEPIVIDLDASRGAALTMLKALLASAEQLKASKINRNVLIMGAAEMLGDLLAEVSPEQRKALTFVAVRELVRERKP